MDMTIHKGVRWNTANAYLRPALLRSAMGIANAGGVGAGAGAGAGGQAYHNLHVVASTLVHSIKFEGQRAVGVNVSHWNDPKGQNMSLIRARKEVIVCGGAINSPQLLMLSGIGNRRDLAELGIPLVTHLPGVGDNLQDHLDLYMQYRCKEPITLYTSTWRFPHNMIRHGVEWFVLKRGKATSAHLESGGFIRSRSGLAHPDIQYHFFPGALTGQLTPGKCHAFQIHVSTMRPTSRGFIKLRSRDPTAHPIIQPNYLTTPDDLVDLRQGVRLTQEIVQQRAFDGYRQEPLSPSADVASDKDIENWIRDHTESAYHPCCTVKMGKDNMSVVDSQGRVHGMEALRVVDASIMPSMISGNLNAPTIMMAEKIADAIKGVPALPPSNAPVYVPKNWQTSQR